MTRLPVPAIAISLQNRVLELKREVLDREAEVERLREALRDLQQRSLLWRDTEFGRDVARMTGDALAVPPNGVVDDANQLKAAWQAGFDHGAAGGSRSADPHINGPDNDLHLAWDEGWLYGSENT